MMGALWESRFKEGKDSWERRERNARELLCSQPRSVQGEGRRCSKPGAVVPCSLGEGCHPAACEHHSEQIPVCSHARAQGAALHVGCQLTESPHRRCRALCWSSWRLGPMVQTHAEAALGELQPVGNPCGSAGEGQHPVGGTHVEQGQREIMEER